MFVYKKSLKVEVSGFAINMHFQSMQHYLPLQKISLILYLLKAHWLFQEAIVVMVFKMGNNIFVASLATCIVWEHIFTNMTFTTHVKTACKQASMNYFLIRNFHFLWRLMLVALWRMLSLGLIVARIDTYCIVWDIACA